VPHEICPWLWMTVLLSTGQETSIRSGAVTNKVYRESGDLDKAVNLLSLIYSHYQLSPVQTVKQRFFDSFSTFFCVLFYH
jgi:hypothetical protein